MKKKTTLIGLAFAIALSLGSCKNETMKKVKNAKDAIGNTKDLIKNAGKIEDNAEELGKRVEELKKLTPFDNEKFKNWMPEKVDGLERSSFNFQSSTANTGTLEFKSDSDNRKFNITIVDGAGEGGSAVYTFQGFYTGLAESFESESDNKTEQVRKRNGQNSLETYYKKDNNSSIKTSMEERFIVEASGENMNPDELWTLIEKLNIKKLK